MRKIGVFLHFFCGLIAAFGGTLSVLNPKGIWGGDIAFFSYSLFDDYVLPAILFLLLISIGNFLSGLLMAKEKITGMTTFTILGAIQVMFMLVQVYILWGFTVMNGIFLTIGFLQLFIGLYLYTKNFLKHQK